MIVVVEKDGYANVGGLYVYGLQYDDETELTGAELDTENDGHIRCRAGSLAMGCGVVSKETIYKLDNNGVWRNCKTGEAAPEPVPLPNYLCFTAEEAGSTVAMKYWGSNLDLTLEYSIDGDTWTDFIVGETTVTLPNIGDKMYMRGNNNAMANSSYDSTSFVMTGKIAASGDITYLLNANTGAVETLAEQAFNSLFYDCDALTHAPELPSIIMAESCYEEMFSGCTSLVSAPELPATTLADSCYKNMFKGCDSLITPPSKLPAAVLVDNCYEDMFNGCTSLATAPELSATTLASYCYMRMFEGCVSLTNVSVKFDSWEGYVWSTLNWLDNVSANGTFTCPAALEDIRDASHIPEGWTKVDL